MLLLFVQGTECRWVDGCARGGVNYLPLCAPLAMSLSPVPFHCGTVQGCSDECPLCQRQVPQQTERSLSWALTAGHTSGCRRNWDFMVTQGMVHRRCPSTSPLEAASWLRTVLRRCICVSAGCVWQVSQMWPSPCSDTKTGFSFRTECCFLKFYMWLLLWAKWKKSSVKVNSDIRLGSFASSL